MAVPRLLRSLAPAVLLLGAVAGCNYDPYERPGTWRPAGVNDYNLQQMVANPADFSRGVAAQTDRGNAGANAATRLFIERRRPLPTLRATPFSSTSQQSERGQPLPGLDVVPGGGGASAGGGAR